VGFAPLNPPYGLLLLLLLVILIEFEFRKTKSEKCEIPDYDDEYE